MPLLDKLNRRLHIIRHAQSRHHNAQPAPRERRNRHLVLYIAQFAPTAAARANDAHVEEFLEEQVFMLSAEGI